MIKNKIDIIEKEIINPTEFLDERRCLILDGFNAYLLEERLKINLCDFFEKSRVVDPNYSGCYVLPNEILTIREIYDRLLVNEIKRLLLKLILEHYQLDDGIKLLISKYKILNNEV